MRPNVILIYIGKVMLCIAAFMALAAVISCINGNGHPDSAFYPLLLSSLLTLVLGLFPMIFGRRSYANDGLNGKEGFAIVVGSWIVACVVGMFPYLIWGGEFSLINAWFESVSGFTATGASILDNIEALPQGLLFWRTSTGWIGGVGVVMFALVILPSFGTTKMALSNVELSSLAKDNFQYRTQIIVRILLSVYVGMTAVATLLLKLAGMRWFDALNHAMSACATCGFSTKNASIGAFDSPMIEGILIVVMLMASIHFGLVYATLLFRSNNIFRSEVVRVYFAIIAVCSLCIGLSIYVAGIYPTFWSSLRYGIFHFTSLITTTGFVTADTNLWPPLAIILLMLASIVCGCAGSTSGGMKVDRVLLFAKVFRSRIRMQQHPNAVIRIRVNGIIQENEQLHSVMTFIVAYVALIFGATISNTVFGLDLLTATSSAISCVGNVGPGFGDVGAVSNYAGLPIILKLQDSLLMLVGRLEIFGFIQLIMLKWWR